MGQGQLDDRMFELLERIAASLEKLELNTVPGEVAQAYDDNGGDVRAARRHFSGIRQRRSGGRWR